MKCTGATTGLYHVLRLLLLLERTYVRSSSYYYYYVVVAVVVIYALWRCRFFSSVPDIDNKQHEKTKNIIYIYYTII